MAATDGGDLEAREQECSFVWDAASNLYFHASSGFYHDPNAGWYYSSRDGLYYTFENGIYVPLTFDKSEESEPQESTNLVCGDPVEVKQGNGEQFTCDGPTNHCPPSEWLEETLIDIYLSGHSDLESITENSLSLQSNEEQTQVSCEGLVDQVTSDKLSVGHQVERVEEHLISKDSQDAEMLTNRSSKDVSSDEEMWQAQYGQVRAMDEVIPNFPVIDLWDWELVVESIKKRQQVTRLFGRLFRPSSKLHPSLPSGGSHLKTASILDVHLDLVRVASGKVYRLRTPNKRYLAALSAYDSSNPTKDWSFPDLLVNMQNVKLGCFNGPLGTKSLNAFMEKKLSVAEDTTPAFRKSNSISYRDRAAERRSLHGEYSIGTRQTDFLNRNSYEEESTSQSSALQEATREAMNMTFGKGSCARKLIERMGWKDGEALGSSTKGILEPLQAVANKGNAGLGWNHIR